MEKLGFICALLLVGEVYGVEEAGSCSVTAAETCMMERLLQFQKASSVYKQHNIIADDLRTVCMTQLKDDKTEKCFQAWTELCTEEEGREIRQKWQDLNSEILKLCQQVCPNINDISTCKSKVYTDEIEDSRFERFCETFNESLQCAEEKLTDCNFGMKMYTDIMAPTFWGYWDFICKSGCHNIDETVLVIRDCINDLRKAPRDQICEYQARFKICVFENPTVCPEVLNLVMFRYRAYNRIEQLCKPIATEPATTPTVSLTTKPTKKTTVSTSPSMNRQTQSLSVDHTTVQEARESLAREDTNITTVDSTTPPPTKTTTATETTTYKMMTDTSDCITEEDIDLFTLSEDTNMDKVMFVLKFESCIHNKTNDIDDLRNIMAMMPSHFLQAYHQTKRESWPVLQAAAPSCSDSGEGCSGHQYGYISCKSSSPRVTDSRMLQSFLLIFSVWRLTLELIRYF